ncbi:MAG: hypothetical protein R3D02_00705 [Hyphomicrobiales bacterium]
MERVGERGGALFVNDLAATNADAAEKALASYDRVRWIAGGKPKEGGNGPPAASARSPRPISSARRQTTSPRRSATRRMSSWARLPRRVAAGRRRAHAGERHRRPAPASTSSATSRRAARRSARRSGA